MWTDKFRKIISFVAAVAIMLSCVPVDALKVEQKAADSAVPTIPLLGKTLSILGDSISTYANYSNGTGAQTTNSTIAGGAIYYPRSGFAVTADSTWWYQAAETLGMELLVNNSWSGSCLLNTRSGTVGAYVDRCVQLHDNTGDNAGELPDIIAIFLGTNDYYTYPGTLGSYEAIDFDALITEGEAGCFYARPVTSLEAYAITLHKITRAYPNAQVYCFTLLPRVNSTNQPTAFNADICQLAEYFGVYTVDLYSCGISSNSTAFYKLMGDSLHPDNPGMDAISNAFVSAVLKNNHVDTYDVAFDLEGAVAMEGTTRTVVSGGTFETTLAPMDASLPLEVTVTMGGADVTASCLTGNVVTIPAVTGEVVITAKPGQREPMNFRWETRGDTLVSVNTDGNTENPLAMTHGTITNGVYTKTRFTMSQGISLRHDLPWCVEWKSSGTWTDTTDGALLFAEANTSATADAYYFYRRHNNDFFAFGSYTGGKYHNYGVKFAGTGIDTTAEHVFRLENRIAGDGSNMVYLYVDDAEVGPLNHHYIGGTDQEETVDWVSGKDFTFSYMGTGPHTIGGCSLEYVQVWEKGIPCDHSYTAEVTLPICTVRGYTDYTCSLCGDTYRTPWLDKTAYEGMTIACVGDSITAAYGVTKDETDYVTLLAEQLGMDYIRLGASGTTLCTDGSRTCNIGKLTEASLNGADVVTIAMGINDFCAAGAGYYELGDIHSTDTSTIYGAARMWCERIVELRKTDSLSDTQFYFVTPVICSWNNSVTANRDWDQSKTNIHGYTLRDMCNAIMEVAALYDVAVIDLNLLSGMYYVDATDNNTAVFGGDGVHPGEKGHEMMAGALANVLLQNDLRDDHEHSYGSWITTTWPSCIAGKQQRVCSVCSAAESRTVESNGNHRYCAVITAPTYTQQGYTTYTCSICGDSYVSDFTDAILPYSYRWEMQDNAMVSVTTGGNTANALTLDSGSITDGILTGVRYNLRSAVHLYHDLPWVIEWRSTGNWSGMLFGSTAQSPSSGLNYLFRDPGTKLFAFGEYNGSWNNYGIILDCDMTVSHVFRLENRIAEDGSNGVYLLVDGQEIDAMHHYYISGSNQNKNVNWANGRDIVFANIGTSSHPVNGMKLDYLQVWENGHEHTYESTVTAPTCTEQGYTTYTCTSCGYSYVSDYTDKLNLTIIPITSAEVEQGGYYYGRDSKSTTRLRVTDQIYVEAGTTVKYSANGLRVFFAIVSGPDANSYLEGGRWYTDSGEFKVTTDGFLSIILSKPNHQDKITVSDYTADIEIHMISECAHDYQVVVTEPTYSSGGYTTHTCTQCGHRYITGYTDKKIYRILLIGNSFSQDSMREFAAVAQSMMGSDFDLEIHLAINAAKTMAWHATQADAGAASYKHRYYFTTNDKWIYEDDPLSTLDSIIDSKQWDVITIQSYYPEVNTGTANGLTGENAEFLSLEKSVPYMLDYIHSHAPHSKVYYFMAWQATTDTTHLDAGRKSFDQILAMTQVLEEYSGTQTGKCFDGVIPVGTAIQNARSTYLGLLNYTASRDAEVVIGLQRDSVHMAYSIGAYIAALTWAEYLFPEEVRAEGYVLSGVPKSSTLGALPVEYSEIAQKAVAAALKNPYTVNALDGYEVDPADVAKEAIESADYCFSGITNETELLAAIQNLVTSHLTKTGFDEPTITLDSYTLKNGVVTDLTATVTFRFGYTTRTVNITKHFHKYTSGVTEPTCTDKGFTTYTCACGDYYVDDYVDATGHDYTDGICIACGVRQTSTFQILDTRSNQMEIFTYEVGMTWREWLNSKYNTGMGSCIAIDVTAGPDILGGNPNMDICMDGIPVDYDDVICERDDLELIRYR